MACGCLLAGLPAISCDQLISPHHRQARWRGALQLPDHLGCAPPRPQASRLGITNVVSTDSIRHMMRSFHSKEEHPLVWASTYQAGEAARSLRALASLACCCIRS